MGFLAAGGAGAGAGAGASTGAATGATAGTAGTAAGGATSAAGVSGATGAAGAAGAANAAGATSAGSVANALGAGEIASTAPAAAELAGSGAAAQATPNFFERFADQFNFTDAQGNYDVGQLMQKLIQIKTRNNPDAQNLFSALGGFGVDFAKGVASPVNNAFNTGESIQVDPLVTDLKSLAGENNGTI